jgi:chromosome segregation ATPase
MSIRKKLSAVPEPVRSTTSLRLSNGLTLRGVWQESHERITQLEQKIEIQKEYEGLLGADVESLLNDRTRLREKCRDAASLLMSHQSNNIDLAGLLNEAIQEKATSEKKYLLLFDEVLHLRAENNAMKNRIGAHEINEKMMVDSISRNEEVISIEKAENKELTEILWKKDEAIEALDIKIATLKNELEILKHSNETRERQLLAIIKERDRLRDSLGRTTRNLIPSTNVSKPTDEISTNSKVHCKELRRSHSLQAKKSMAAIPSTIFIDTGKFKFSRCNTIYLT